MGRKKKLAEPSIDAKQARSVVKVGAVLLRDHSPLQAEEILRLFINCWDRTESVVQARGRDDG